MGANLATESHRQVSSFREAVEEWNRRHKDDGYRSSYAPQMKCLKCEHVGAILSTIHGLTKATCGDETCRHMWVLA